MVQDYLCTATTSRFFLVKKALGVYTRLAGASVFVDHRPRGVAIADPATAASVANSRHGSPDALERKDQPPQQTADQMDKSGQEQIKLAGDELASAAAKAPVSKSRLAVKSEPQVTDCAEAVAAADVKTESAAAVEEDSRVTTGRATTDTEPAAGDKDTAAIDDEKAGVDSARADAADAVMSDAEADATGKSKRHTSNNSKVVAKAASAAGSTPLSRPSRKAAAEASIKMAKQLGPGSNAHSGTVEAEKPHVVSTGKRKRDRSSAAGSTAAAEEPAKNHEGAKPSAAQSQQQQSEGDAALAAQLAASSRSRPTRRAAADASAKIAAQSQNLPIYKLAEEASKAAAASGSKEKSSKQRSERKDSKDGQRSAKSSAGANYVLPPDHVAGSWRFVSDTVEGLQALAAELQVRSAPEDVALGRLLQDHVVATLLERKEREEKVRGE